MADHLLKTALAEAKRAGVTHWNTDVLWLERMPSKPGKWWLDCYECEGSPELVTVESRGGDLWAVNCEVCTLPVKDLHNGLTNCLWKEAQPI